MVTIALTDHDLIVTLADFDSLLALKSHISVPLSHVRGATLDNAEARQTWHGIRVPGTAIPGVVAVGSFYKHGAWAFFDVRNPYNVITILLDDEHYTRLVIEVADPAASVAAINQAIVAQHSAAAFDSSL